MSVFYSLRNEIIAENAELMGQGQFLTAMKKLLLKIVIWMIQLPSILIFLVMEVRVSFLRAPAPAYHHHHQIPTLS